MENIIVNIIFATERNQTEVMETLWTILWIVGVTIALFLFYCGGWWPRTWFRGFLFTLLSFAFLPIVTFPIQYVIWKFCNGGWLDEGLGESSAYCDAP